MVDSYRPPGPYADPVDPVVDPAHPNFTARLGTGVEVRGVTLLTPSVIDIVAWRAPYACTVTGVRGYRVGGTGLTVNARKNGTLAHLVTDLSLTLASTWMMSLSVEDVFYAAGDTLEIQIKTVTGVVSQVAVLVELTR